MSEEAACLVAHTHMNIMQTTQNTCIVGPFKISRQSSSVASLGCHDSGLCERWNYFFFFIGSFSFVDGSLFLGW